MKVSNFVKQSSISVPPDTSITEAIALMDKNNSHHLAVVDGVGVPVGVVNYFSILASALPPGVLDAFRESGAQHFVPDLSDVSEALSSHLSDPVGSIMLDPLIIDESESITAAVSTFISQGERSSLIVTNAAGAYTGIVTPSSLVRLLLGDDQLPDGSDA